MKFLAVKITMSQYLIISDLLKKEVGDLAVVNTPAGEASWYVNAIEYVKP